ncbi:unnamed protein product [Chrysodeixis includens]|uniref:Chitin-binding type-2 domain-containing protein n=1 Tax=Chrysodeixis includens TaxID=689277 RepID=A0A9P0FQ60_CHRIL|nr:unnamed protein product [Chrysodeixis includens]
MRAPLALLLLCCSLSCVLSFSLRVSEASTESAVSCATHSVTAVRCGAWVGPAALLPHPDHCQLFYYCEPARARPTCRQCPAGLHFSPALLVCDWPQHAGCTAGSANSTTVASETTTAVSNATWSWSSTSSSPKTTDNTPPDITAQPTSNATESTETSSTDAASSTAVYA